jgi:hypothetical protein
MSVDTILWYNPHINRGEKNMNQDHIRNFAP